MQVVFVMVEASNSDRLIIWLTTLSIFNAVQVLRHFGTGQETEVEAEGDYW